MDKELLVVLVIVVCYAVFGLLIPVSDFVMVCVMGLLFLCLFLTSRTIP